MQKLTESDYRQIIIRRDPRYDGRLFFGVKTTKIYCRPVCPARPKFENIIVYKSASAAEQAGCRPCLRCRPDLAPGNRFIDPGGTLAAKGLRLIEEDESNQLSIESIAATLAISGRHLRRVFDEQLGASPVKIMQSRRLHHARQLLLETGEAVSDIAFAAGFQSVRRFNESFKSCYRTTPSALRTTRKNKIKSGEPITLSLMVRKPYNFVTMLAFLKRHCAQGIEKVDTESYERYIPSKESYSKLRVTINDKQDRLLVTLDGFKPAQFYPVLLRVRRLFDADHNPSHLPLSLEDAHAGVRIPGAYDPFEVAVSIILGQLISIQQATNKLSVVIQQFGSVVDKGLGIYCFPSPVDLQNAEVEQIGITRTKATAIRTLSTMMQNGELSFSYSADLAQTREKLLSIKGIGPWTTEMIMMRCFGDADASPVSDLIIKRALQQNLVDETLWKTNRSYMTHYIWNKYAKTLSKR
jgi:AraC family transcriptional regulator, regulatory protein of adaptative response / DNA-3-methyladenine glycosylase II